jgi:hypothetical protein
VQLERLRVVSALPPDGGWRAELALDRSVSPPRPVLVARVPPAVAGDALALAMLARGVDLASRVRHPSLRRLLGTSELQGDLVLVEAWREGETLDRVLAAGGPLDLALASRVAVDVAGALHACHTLPAALGRPLCHGAVLSERILVAENGEVLLCGMGRPFAEDASPEDDLRQLARLLLESLPPASNAAPGTLAAVLDRVLVGEGYPTAATFAEAVVAAVAPADPAAVVARVEASQPEGRPAWLGRRRVLEQALGAEAEAASGAAVPAAAPVAAARQAPHGAAPPPPFELAAPAGWSPPEDPPPLAGTAPAPEHTPPPFPAAVPAVRSSTAPTNPTMARSAPPASDEEAAGQFVELARPESPTAARRADPLAAWLDHPRAPLLVVVGLGLIGLLLGVVLGGR